MGYDDIMDRRMDAAENSAEKRRIEIEKMADYLMEKGNEYDPFSQYNLSEAMANFSDSVIAGFSHAMYAGSYELAGSALSHFARSYWLPFAMKEAERRVDGEA